MEEAGGGDVAGRQTRMPAAPLSDAQLAAIVGLATDAIIAVDECQRITMFNDGAERIFGYSATEVAGQPLSLLLPDALCDSHADHMRRFAAAPETARRMGERREIMGRRQTGETFPAEASIAKLRTAAGWTFLAILRDVSAAHRRERQLSQAQAMAHLGGWEWDIQTNAVSWTDELYRIYGLEPGGVRLSLETFMERLVPEDRVTTRAAIEHALTTGLPFDYEERIIRPDGAVRLLRSTGEVFLDAAGRPVRLVGVCQDITERRAAERKALDFEREKAARSAAEQAAAQLRESEERFRTVADNAPVLIWMAGPDARSNFFNRVWLEFTGRPEEEEEGSGWLSGVHPEDVHRCTEAMAHAFATRAPFDVQYRLRRHDGQYRWLLHHGVPRLLPGGEFAGFIGSCADITDQIEQQQALRTANEELAAARAEAERIAHRVVRLQQLTASLSQARTLPDVVDVVMNEGLRLLEADRGAIGMLAEDGIHVDFVRFEGFTQEAEAVYRATKREDALPAVEALRTGRPVWIRSADEYRRRYPAAWERLHRLLTIETVAALPLSGGASRPVGVLVVAFPSAAAFGVTDEAFTSLIGQVAGPALERARAFDDERLGRKRAEAAARAREEALAVVAHDLRNPLNLIATNAAFLREGALPPEQRTRLLEITERSVRQMDRLIADLLDEARIQAGRFTVQPDLMRIEEVVDEAIHAWRADAEHKGVRLTAAVDPGPPVRADRDRILQVLHNLIGNAVKFTEAGEVEVLARRGSDCLVCSVRDTGPGIQKAHLPRLFERYWQADRQDRRGAGLGLPIARGIVEAHGGRIWLESEVGSGTTFFFTLPEASAGPPD